MWLYLRGKAGEQRGRGSLRTPNTNKFNKLQIDKREGQSRREGGRIPMVRVDLAKALCLPTERKRREEEDRGGRREGSTKNQRMEDNGGGVTIVRDDEG